MIHDTHLDNRVDVIRCNQGSEKLAEQSGAMIGSVKQSKEVSTIALDSTMKACKCSVDFGVNMHRFSDIGADTAYDVQSDVGRTETLPVIILKFSMWFKNWILLTQMLEYQ